MNEHPITYRADISYAAELRCITADLPRATYDDKA